jgi:O-acetyl-ADP-ribose deacetylase (regulator of RNase III)
MKIEVVIGNIVKQPDMEAIVNSANANLRMGSGVAGAIHTAAGPRLEEYCRPFAPLELGSALITPGFQLPNRWIIHVRAAHYINNTEPERYLAFAISSMINTARDNNVRSVAMPAIGIGVFKFPIDLAARITAQTLRQHSNSGLELMRICTANEQTCKSYTEAMDMEYPMLATLDDSTTSLPQRPPYTNAK